MNVERSDMEKICDALGAAEQFFTLRDRSNASIHLAKSVRFSPITTTVQAARERLEDILQDAQ
jgi:hypothetical protein